jgi:hypothetical protein
MIKKILLLLGLFFLNGCAGAVFERGLNYQETPEYSFEYDKGTSGTSIKNNDKLLYVEFRRGSCGFYGLIGPLIFPIIPFWQNNDCRDVIIGVSQANKVQIIYHDNVYEPSKVVRGGGYFFPLPIKSINDTAILAVEKKDGEKFEIPFRYQHTFSFDLWPGR